MKVVALLVLLMASVTHSFAATKSVVDCERELGEAASDRKLVNDCLLLSMGIKPDPTPEEIQKEIQKRRIKNDADRTESMAIAAAGPIKASTELVLSFCDLKYTTSMDGDLLRCISDGKASLKQSYEKTLKSLKKPAAKAALKEYYITAISTLIGIKPQDDERKINYEKRQGDNKNKLDEMWTRFEVEN